MKFFRRQQLCYKMKKTIEWIKEIAKMVIVAPFLVVQLDIKNFRPAITCNELKSKNYSDKEIVF